MRKLTLIYFVSLLVIMTNVSCTSDDYKDVTLPTNRRVEALLSEMTLIEKFEQINILVLGKMDNVNNVTQDCDNEGRQINPTLGAVILSTPDVAISNKLQRRAVEESRLGIPVLFAQDVIHGCRTLFPIPLAQSCAWNRDLVHASARIAARESYLSGIRWTFSPMLDVARDARWGRVAESYGEDPYTNAEFAHQVVSGYQGEHLSDPYSIAACLKHFAGYAYSQSGRDYNPTQVSDLSMWETVLPPYQAAIDAGAATVMSSFNDLNGVPTVANRRLLTDLLRHQLGFEGFVVSDWRSVEQLIAQRYAHDGLDASVKAITAGNDMDMYDYLYRQHLDQALDQGLVDMETIDQAVRRILKVKFDLGLFENPYVDACPDSLRYLLPMDKELAQRLAEESMVLLKNDKQTLPLSNKIKHIVLAGPLSNERVSMMGTWRSFSQPSDAITLLEGIKQTYADQAEVAYVEGFSFQENKSDAIHRLQKAARNADVVLLALGESAWWSGENGSTASLELPESQVELVRAARACGCPVVLLTASGRPLALAEVEPLADAILHIWQPGLYGGPAVARILSGAANPSGRLAITFPHCTGQVPIFYNYRPNARNQWGGTQGVYHNAPTAPLYPFGYGLSYSEYTYGELTATKKTLTKDETIELTVTIHNDSDCEGSETVFWYVDDPVASITQPVKKLKYFEKKTIPAHQSMTYIFRVDPMRDLSFVDAQGKVHLERGVFNIMVKDQSIPIILE